MPKILFWNVHRKRVDRHVANLARHYDLDLLVLAECTAPALLLEILNDDLDYMFAHVPGECQRIHVLVRNGVAAVPIRETQWMTIRRIEPDTENEWMLAAVHLPSKMYMSDESQKLMCRSVIAEIEDVEAECRHTRTCLVGDFNMNPFEPGIAGAGGLHATMSRRIASKDGRTIMGKEYRFFYNPMWSHFGDAAFLEDDDHSIKPPGTYYKRMSEHLSYEWNLFDQVMVRPALLSRFANTSVKILTSDGEVSLLNRAGVPDSSVASDHLPLMFAIK